MPKKFRYNVNHPTKKKREKKEKKEKKIWGKNFSVGLDRKRNCSKDKEVEEEVA